MAKRPSTKKKGLTAKEAAADQPNLSIIYIHGIANKPAPAVLKRQWDMALFGVDMGSRTRMAYWADIRYPQPLPSTMTEAKAMILSESYRPRSDEEIIDESKQLAPYGKDAEAFAEKLAKRILNQAKKDQIKAKDVQAKILPPGSGVPPPSGSPSNSSKMSPPIFTIKSSARRSRSGFGLS
ncbi:MAG: hypothetical protein MPW14_13610 [Candidatus Manganitrophus sp.]|nr:hypothetical protein [Candidatus Manganitrophus sp.]MDC4223694.1 hypothetical protein [Candidatus Manganitrophus sp.]WDT78254.1 MAG: hypothetical protein MPW14_13610 [Candidatus Manganitrophus sp.]